MPQPTYRDAVGAFRRSFEAAQARFVQLIESSQSADLPWVVQNHVQLAADLDALILGANPVVFVASGPTSKTVEMTEVLGRFSSRARHLLNTVVGYAATAATRRVEGSEYDTARELANQFKAEFDTLRMKIHTLI